jgi:anti-sigma28 factor (negative regulator of flagellin synthesis)
VDKIEALIKKLQEAKQELEKNLNCAPGMASPNMAKEEMEKDAKNPALAPKDVKVKELQGKIDAGTYKPDAKKIADKILKDEAMAMGEGCEMKDMKTHANGQWSMKKGAFKELEHKLEDEGKSKESAGAIAYTVGKEKYGKKGMEAKAKAGEAKKSDDEGAC